MRFREYVVSDLNRDSLFSGVKAMAFSGILALILGYALDFVLFLYSGVVFLLLAVVFFSFLLGWYLRALEWDRQYLNHRQTQVANG